MKEEPEALHARLEALERELRLLAGQLTALQALVLAQGVQIEQLTRRVEALEEPRPN